MELDVLLAFLVMFAHCACDMSEAGSMLAPTPVLAPAADADRPQSSLRPVYSVHWAVGAELLRYCSGRM